MFSRFLVVCTGNICRSPMGEAFLRQRLQGLENVVVRSAGIGAVVDAPAHEHAVTVMQEKGLDLEGHIACQLDVQHTREFDLLFVMEAKQKEWIGRRFPQLRGRVYRLGHWLECDVPDPIGLEIGAFREARDLIEMAVDSWLERLPGR